MTYIITLFMWFIIYSTMGWIYESILCSVQERKLVNRGFLTGPICPVYGFGAIAVIMLLNDIKGNYIALFLAGSILTCTIEYLTAYILEKSFKAKWWDYSQMRFNLNGRVCLLGAIVFGAFSVLLVEWIHPVISSFTEKIPDNIVITTSVVVLLIIFADLTLTVYHIFKLNGRLAEIQDFINAFINDPKKQADNVIAALQESVEGIQIAERLRELLNKDTFQGKRILKAFPKFESLNYNDALKRIKEKLHNKK